MVLRVSFLVYGGEEIEMYLWFFENRCSNAKVLTEPKKINRNKELGYVKWVIVSTQYSLYASTGYQNLSNALNA